MTHFKINIYSVLVGLVHIMMEKQKLSHALHSQDT